MPLHRILPLVGLALVALPLSAADKAPWILEQAIEVRASAIVLPSSAGGTLVVTRCTGCAPQSFVTTSRTRYQVASEPITLVALRAAFTAAPGAGLTVFYDSRSREVTRVIASAALASRVAPPPGDRPGAQR